MRLRVDVLAFASFMLLIAAPSPALTAQPLDLNHHPAQKFISEVDVDSCRAQGGKWAPTEPSCLAMGAYTNWG